MEIVPAIEMLLELEVLKHIMQCCVEAKASKNLAIDMLKPDQLHSYMYKTSACYKNAFIEKMQLEGLLEEELDAIIPTNIMWEQLTSK
jgi:hypothetical protein